jgi:pantoate--beta-alanine ligase
MLIAQTLPELHAARLQLGACALVPTMGNLHQGHLSLVALARASGLPIVASIFVNRLQFAPGDDFDSYPRTLGADLDLLRQAGCDLVFAPHESDLYPQPQRFRIAPDPALADILEGHFRPGFFAGVCTVVMKLLCCVRPQVAVFGRKDYQQLLVVRRMAEQFALPIEIVGAETVRAPDGLALSSRNAYLDAKQRSEAAELYRALTTLVDNFRRRTAPLDELEAQASAQMVASGWVPDYLVIRRRADLQPPATPGKSHQAMAGPADDASDGTAHDPVHDTAGAEGEWVALGAARLGTTRLIDNIEF